MESSCFAAGIIPKVGGARQADRGAVRRGTQGLSTVAFAPAAVEMTELGEVVERL